MARFFGGMGGSGTGSRFGGSKKGGTMGNAGARTGGVKKASDMTPDERYQALIQEKLSAQKTELMQSKKYGHQIPGTSSQSKEVSKSTQAALEIMAAKMAKREMKALKKKPKTVEVKPTHVGGSYGGWIDAKGRIWAPGNKQVLQIDMKTGDMKTTGFFGRKIGKYDPKSQFCFNKINKVIEKQVLKDNKGSGGSGSIWGTTGGGSASDIYGSNGWGGSNNDKGSGWW